MDDHELAPIVTYLGDQFRRGRPLLVTGAGFSRDAYNLAGKPCPTAPELVADLCRLTGEPLEPDTHLQDVFENARRSHHRQLGPLLQQLLTIDPARGNLARYETIFSLPWYRCYTLNIDSLPRTVGARYSLPRNVRMIDGMPNAGQVAERRGTIGNTLFVVGLNGVLENAPDGITFGRLQYADRTQQTDTWYSTFLSELMLHPVVFCGTTLDEPPLWEQVKARQTRGGRSAGEHRPKSFLVTPHLNASRARLLESFNVALIPMTFEDFVDRVLDKVRPAAADGYAALQTLSDATQMSGENDSKLFTVDALLDETKKGDVGASARSFLFGSEPGWGDILSRAAAERTCDKELLRRFDEFPADKSSLLVISGTAGNGKSTCTKRLALTLHSRGNNVAWVDQYHRPRGNTIRTSLEAHDAPDVIFVEDGDIYGDRLESLVRALLSIDRAIRIIVVLRSHFVERFLSGVSDPGGEFSIPPLTDDDIDGIVDSLERHNRLGVLKKLLPAQRRKVFVEKCGRQLLVAMIEATSGLSFDERCHSEYQELTETEKRFYEIACLATSRRIALAREDYVLATDQHTNPDLAVLASMVQRGLLVSVGPTIRARHRVISEKVVGVLAKEHRVGPVASGLLFALCVKIDFSLPRHARPWKNITSLLNNEFLYSMCEAAGAEQVYSSLEELLHNDYHYWLQRGALHVKYGDILLAKNFLEYASALQPDDLYVRVERSYMALKFAYSFPKNPDANELARNAIETLVEIIKGRGRSERPPYHTLGSQALAWSRKGRLTSEERVAVLELSEEHVERGVALFPRDTELKRLLTSLTREKLSVATGAE